MKNREGPQNIHDKANDEGMGYNHYFRFAYWIVKHPVFLWRRGVVIVSVALDFSRLFHFFHTPFVHLFGIEMHGSMWRYIFAKIPKVLVPQGFIGVLWIYKELWKKAAERRYLISCMFILLWKIIWLHGQFDLQAPSCDIKKKSELPHYNYSTVCSISQDNNENFSTRA